MFSIIFHQIRVISSTIPIDLNTIAQLVMFSVLSQAPSQVWSKSKWLSVKQSNIVQIFPAIFVSEKWNNKIKITGTI